jgi:hypothetical protein
MRAQIFEEKFMLKLLENWKIFLALFVTFIVISISFTVLARAQKSLKKWDPDYMACTISDVKS